MSKLSLLFAIALFVRERGDPSAMVITAPLMPARCQLFTFRPLSSSIVNLETDDPCFGLGIANVPGPALATA